MKEAEYLELSDQERDAWVDEFIMGLVMVHGERKYSTDYNAMMRVVEKMRDAGYHIAIHVSCADEWIVDIGDGYYGVNDDLRKAVYLAAGRALGVIE